MLDVNIIRENPDKVREGITKKNVDPKLVDKFLRLDDEWRKKIAALDQLKAEQNKVTSELAEGRRDYSLNRAQILKKRIIQIKGESETFGKKRDEVLSYLPNLPFKDVPVGKDESFNKVLREVGKKPKFKFQPKSHLDLAENLGLIDIQSASQVTGTRFSYILRDAVLLEFGLVKLAYDTLLPHGFIPVVPPVMIRPEAFAGMGRLAADQKEERYYLPKDDLYLVGSAEHTIGPMHMNKVLNEKTLPRRYVGFSTCFRREAGSYGKDTKGILRVHQFDKVEMFSFTKPKDSVKEYEILLSLQEKLMEKLDIPYRVVEICTGDMGWTDAQQHDIEAWLPGEGTYRETHSCSNTTDFQARGVNTKYEMRGEKKEFVHMLNATAFAIGRTLVAIFENYQTQRGTIKVPKALKDYVGKSEIGRK
ncbi:MAG: serine--tRNA ligase [Patescibacteria group bacterium]|nr:serine--tRNA ligase [Patescibacteria group bacterium]